MKTFRPLTPSQRYATVQDFSDITKNRPEKSLTYRKRGTGGRNNHGRVTVRARGGGHARRIREIDWLRSRAGAGKVVAIEYDPNRSARIALVQYGGGEKSYIIAPEGLVVGVEISSGREVPPSIGNALPLCRIPVGTDVHCVEMLPGAGARMVRSAGGFATLMAVDGGYAQLRLPSGEIRKVHQNCMATVGKVGNSQWENLVLGKAGRARWLGIRPLTRGMARNPVDHPNGGGQGKSKGGGGRQHLMSPWGKLAKGQKTRKKHKLSDKFIVVRRNGKPLKAK